MAQSKEVARIRLRRGTTADIIAEELDVGIHKVSGEPRYDTDTKQLFIRDTDLIMQPVQTIDMLVVFDDDLVFYNDEVVYVY